MEKKVKADQIPSQADRLYVQLYCERKGVKDKKTIQEAKKSWASLSHSKRNLFYKTTFKRNLLNYVHGLRQTKTFLKEKVPKIRDQNLCKLHYSNEELAKELEKHESIEAINESCLTENGSQDGEENESINHKSENNTKLEDDNETSVVNIGTPEPETQPNEGRPLFELSPSHTTNNTKLQEADETQEDNIGSPLCDPGSHKPVDEIEDALETQSNASPVLIAAPLTEPTPPTIKDEIEDALETQSNASTVLIAVPLTEPTTPTINDEIEDALETQNNASTVQIAVPLAEPTPPTIKTGKDLYEMIKRPGSAEWKDLSIKEKSHLNSAVRTIKRDYIKNYTKYLESLSQQQLFDHYIKTFC